MVWTQPYNGGSTTVGGINHNYRDTKFHAVSVSHILKGGTHKMSNTVRVQTPTGAEVHVTEEMRMVNGALHLYYTVTLQHTSDIQMIYDRLVCTRGVNTQTMTATYITKAPRGLSIVGVTSAASLTDIVRDLKDVYGAEVTLADMHQTLTE